jgi:S1-C subfamily serine protease
VAKSKIKKNILNLFLILIIGGLGGILADQFLLPYLASVSPFSKIQFIDQAGNGTTIINPTEKITITENEGLEKAIDKIKPTLVLIKTYQYQKVISQGTGFIVTNDGLIVTALDLVPETASQYYILYNNKSLLAELIKKDTEQNLALLKIEENNLPVVSLAKLEEIKLGERVVIVGLEENKEKVLPFVNLGIIRSLNGEILKINLTEENVLANGSPLINIKGEILGLNLVDQKGLIKTIPANIIQKFISL